MVLGLGSTKAVPNFSDLPRDEANSGSATKQEKSPYTVTDLNSKNEGGVGYVTGTLTNNTGDKKSYVQIEINLLDKSGAVVGSTSGAGLGGFAS